MGYKSSKLDSIKPYKVDKTKYDIRLDANESFITFSEDILEEVQRKIASINFNRYPDSESEEVCKLYSEYCGAKRQNIMAGNGSDELIQIIINGFLGKDEKILTLKPDFSMYKFYSSIMEGKVIELSLNENMEIDVDKIIDKVKEERPKIVIFSNPNNPTGSVISREDIFKIVESSDSLIIVDEAYYEFYGESVIDSVDKYENLIVLRTCSKAMGMAAARLGFLIANEKLVEIIRKVKPPFNINGLTQAVGEVILSKPALIKSNIQNIIDEREYLLEKLKTIEAQIGKEVFGMFPTGANFVYIKSNRAEEIYRKLLDESISIRSFGNGTIRITVGSREENNKLIFALKKILEA